MLIGNINVVNAYKKLKNEDYISALTLSSKEKKIIKFKKK